MFAHFPWQDLLVSQSHFGPLQLHQTMADPASTPRINDQSWAHPKIKGKERTAQKDTTDPPDSVQVSLISNEQLATCVRSKPQQQMD